MPRKGEFPTRENCDPDNPEEAFLWMFAALPGVRGGQLMMPIDYYRQISKRLWELGARPVAEPTLEYVPPTATEPNWTTSPGRWVPVGTAPKRTMRDQAEDALTNMSYQQKAELLTALEVWESEGSLPDSKAGRVAATLNDEQRTVVLDVLRGQRGA